MKKRAMKTCMGLYLVIAFPFWMQGTTQTINSHESHAMRDSVITLSIGGGATFSTVNVGLEPVGELKHGWNARMSVKFKRRIGLTAEYTTLLTHDAIPAWGAIQARNLDLNLNYMYFDVAETKSKFYGLIGVCVQQWKGTYLGTPAFDRDVYNYHSGDIQQFLWPTMNLGIGFDRLYHAVGVFGEFKFRFGQDYPNDPFGIVDVAVTLGMRVNLVTIGKPRVAPTNHRHSHKMGIKPKIYHWF